MNKSTTAEKIKIKFSKFHFFLPFLEIFGGDFVKQLNKFVWPNQTYILIHMYKNTKIFNYNDEN